MYISLITQIIEIYLRELGRLSYGIGNYVDMINDGQNFSKEKTFDRLNMILYTMLCTFNSVDIKKNFSSFDDALSQASQMSGRTSLGLLSLLRN